MIEAKEALANFKLFVKTHGKVIENLKLREAVELMIDFYSTIRAEDCPGETVSDEIGVCWGICNRGGGEFFGYQLFRRIPAAIICESGGARWEDIVFWRLELEFSYSPTESLRSLMAGEKVCYSTEKIGDFKNFIQNSQATSMAEMSEILSVNLDYYMT